MIPSSMCLLFSYIGSIVQLSIVLPTTFVVNTNYSTAKYCLICLDSASDNETGLGQSNLHVCIKKGPLLNQMSPKSLNLKSVTVQVKVILPRS
jgi:hypothetical protein